MTRRTTSTLLVSALGLTVAIAAACGRSGGGDVENGFPTPTAVTLPYDVCVAHFEVDVADDPEVANLLLAVLLAENWDGSQSVSVDGANGALYADYHYAFAGPQPPDYVGALSTSATVTVTGTSGALGAAVALSIAADPAWYVTSSTADAVTGGAGSASGVLQPLADCLSGTCTFGTGGVGLMVNGSALTLGETNPDGVTVFYCRDLPASFAGWRPGKPLPPGFREVLR